MKSTIRSRIVDASHFQLGQNGLSVSSLNLLNNYNVSIKRGSFSRWVFANHILYINEIIPDTAETLFTSIYFSIDYLLGS